MLIALLIVVPMLAALVLYILGRRAEHALDGAASAFAWIEFALSLALLALYCCRLRRPELPELRLAVPGILGGALSFLPGGLGAVYGALASLLWLGSTVFSRQYFLHEREHLPSYWALIFFTLGAVQGLFLSDNFLCAFFFFELLSFSSFPWVMHERTVEAIRAGKTYLAVAVLGGLILFFGLLLLADTAGSLNYNTLPHAMTAAGTPTLLTAGVCILLGFGAKAGMFPLHVWLPKAHPVAPAPASALLSGMLTKVGIFGVLMCALYVLPKDRMFGTLILCAGMITMTLGAVLALFSVNLKRTLACSSMSQVGFILTGAAAFILCGSSGEEEGVDLALAGVMLHMVNHSLLKLVLFLSSGTVAMNFHALELNDIRGCGRGKPLLMIPFLIAALGISGVPFFNGYLSKTLLHEGLVEAIHSAGIWPGTEWLFLFSGGLTFAYMLRLFICLFVENNSDRRSQAVYDSCGAYLSPRSAAVLLAGAALLLPMGIPGFALPLSALMAGNAPDHFAAFSLGNLRGSGISLGAGALVYLAIARPVLQRGGVYRQLWPWWLDLEDSVYRPLLLRVLPSVLGAPARLFGENLVLRPACRALVFLGSVVGRALETVSDALILLLVRTVLREEKVRDERIIRRGGRFRSVEYAIDAAWHRVMDNFSYAMMMTCIGIILILGILALFT